MKQITIETARRVFTLGALELHDPDPNLDPDAALALYRPNFPQLQGATLAPPTFRADGAVVYAVERSPVQTKG
jgi:PRTRC genetic system protein C